MSIDLKVYARYASMRHPERLGKVYITHTERTLTIEEQIPYKKAYIHLLLMPRVGAPPYTVDNLVDLRTLLTSPEITKQEAHNLLLAMKEDAEDMVRKVKSEMLGQKKCTWDIWTGFHLAPSLQYLHLHIISCDLTGDGLTKVGHYNRFDPNYGYFIHLSDLLEKFDEHMEPAYDMLVRKLRHRDNCRKLLSRPLNDPDRKCHYENCKERFSSIDELKAHLKWHFERLLESRKKVQERIEKMAGQRERRERSAV